MIIQCFFFVFVLVCLCFWENAFSLLREKKSIKWITQRAMSHVAWMFMFMNVCFHVAWKERNLMLYNNYQHTHNKHRIYHCHTATLTLTFNIRAKCRAAFTNSLTINIDIVVHTKTFKCSLLTQHWTMINFQTFRKFLCLFFFFVFEFIFKPN